MSSLCAENRCPGDRRVLRADVWHFQKLRVRLHPLLPVQGLSRWQRTNGTALALWKSGWGRRRGSGYAQPLLQTLSAEPRVIQVSLCTGAASKQNAGAVNSRVMWVAQSSPYRCSSSLEVFNHQSSHRHALSVSHREKKLPGWPTDGRKGHGLCQTIDARCSDVSALIFCMTLCLLLCHGGVYCKSLCYFGTEQVMKNVITYKNVEKVGDAFFLLFFFPTRPSSAVKTRHTVCPLGTQLFIITTYN